MKIRKKSLRSLRKTNFLGELVSVKKELKRKGFGINSAIEHRSLLRYLGQKMKRENILEAMTSATNYLENSMKAIAKEDEKELTRFVWRAAADLEYALFLFSLMRQNETESSSWKLDPYSKQVEIEPTLMATQDLLKEAKDSFEADELHEAHKKTWMARAHLLRVHEFFEKRRRKGEKFALSP